MYRYITLILFSSLFSINKDLNETTLLFHLNHTTNDLSIINSEDRIVTNPELNHFCLLYTSPSPRDRQKSRMPSSA